jgi:hypothetical protein
MIGAGVFAVPLLAGAVAYVCGGLVFALGFPRLLAKRVPLAGTPLAAAHPDAAT